MSGCSVAGSGSRSTPAPTEPRSRCPPGAAISSQLRGIEAGAGTVYLQRDFHVFRRRGAGPWHELRLPGGRFAPEVFAVSPADPRRLIAIGLYGSPDGCSQNVTARSDDAGDTWTVRADFGRHCPYSEFVDFQVVMDPTSRDRTFVVDWQGIWRTDNGGAGWVLDETPAGFFYHERLAIPAPGTDLDLSLGAARHRPVAGGPWQPGAGPCALAVPEPVLLGLGGVGCSGTGDTAPGATGIVQPTPTTAALASVLGRAVLRRTGSSWLQSATGIRELTAFDVVRAPDGTLVATTEIGVVRRLADGRWVEWADGLPPPVDGVIPSTGSLALDRLGQILTANDGRLWRRAAADAAWSELPVPGGKVGAVERASGPLYVSTDAALRVSDDDGATFRTAPFVAVGMAAAPSRPGTAYAIEPTDAGSWHLYRTTDGGVTWRHVSDIAAAFAVNVDPADADRIALPGAPPPISLDDGETWLPQNDIAFLGNTAYLEAVAFDPANRSILYGGGRNTGLWASTDGGGRWTQVDDSATTIRSFLDERPVAATVQARAARPTLFAALGGEHAGVARVTAKARAARLRGPVRHNGLRTLRTATCRGGTVVGGGRTIVRWYAGRRKIAFGRKVVLRGSAVGLPVTCVVEAERFGGRPLRSKAIVPVGTPWTAGRPRVAGNLRPGGVARCDVRFRGHPTSAGYVWRINQHDRGTSRTVRLRAGDAGREVTCTATARNRYGEHATRARGRVAAG